MEAAVVVTTVVDVVDSDALEVVAVVGVEMMVGVVVWVVV